MDISIRPYSKENFQAVSELFDEFQGFIAWLDPLKGNVWRKGFGDVATKETIEEIEKTQGIFLLAFDKDKVVGFITGIIKPIEEIEQYTSAKPQHEGRITELYLTGEYQGKGIGKKLMNAAEDFFKEQDIHVLRVEVFAPNSNAREFYSKRGFQERSLDLLKLI